MDDRIRPGEVDVFEDAGPRRLAGKGEEALHPVGVDHHDLAVLDVADELGADDVERAGLRAQDRTAVELAEHQRADAERIAGADQLLVGQRHQGVGALDFGQRLDEAVDDLRSPRARGQEQDDLGVGRRLADRAAADELAPERQAVGQVAVMGDRKAARLELGEQRLDVAQHRLAGGRVADMADGGLAGKAVDDGGAGEVIADETLAPLGMKALAVEGDDAGRLLAAVLQGVQAERDDRRRVGVAEDPEDAAFLVQAVLVEIDAGIGVRVRPRRTHCFGAAGTGRPLISASSFCLSVRDVEGAAASGFLCTTCGLAAGGVAGFDSGRRARLVVDRLLVRRSDVPRDLIQASIVVAASSGNRATILSAVSVRIGRVFAVFTHSGCCLSATSQLKIANATTASRKPRATPNTKPERPVERADLAVENRVRQSHGEQRNDDQRGEEHQRRRRRLQRSTSLWI